MVKSDVLGFMLLLLGGLIITDYLITHTDEQLTGSPEYKQGYNTGITEHNETKYNAAVNITESLFVTCTKEQYHYAQGYKAGCNEYLNNLTSFNLNNETKQDLTILGI